MVEESFRRKLTAILSADVVGYSRLMGIDDEKTVRSLNAHKALIADFVRRFRGRVVDAPGDNLLAEFVSAVDAVGCAVQIQKQLAERNALQPKEFRMDFRIGINIGDVIEEEDRLYGDGVNIAARIEKLALAGGICLSASIYEQVANKLDFEYEFIGEQTVKNIAKPVRVYRLIDTDSDRPVGSFPKIKRWAVRGAVAALLVCVVIFAVFKAQFLLNSFHTAFSKSDGLPVAAKPAIAVLPFENMSQDKELDYFADGMTDDIITNLSQISGLSVVARNSVLVYKAKPTKPQQVAADLNVQYVLECSIRGVGDQVLVNAQFLQAATGQHVWAERYDLNMKDVFAMQVDITMKVVNALNLELTEEDMAAMKAKGEAYLSAYLTKMRAGDQKLDPKVKDVKAEMIFWESIKNSEKPEMFEEYLKQFPDGIFAGIAKIFAKKPAVRPSAQPTAQQSTADIAVRTAAEPEEHPAETVAGEAVRRKTDSGRYEEIFWQSIRGSSNVEEYQEFLQKFPDGIFAGLAEIKIKTLMDERTGAKKRWVDRQIQLAILPCQHSIGAGYEVLAQRLKSVGEENERPIALGLAAALSESKAFKVKLSYYRLGKGLKAEPLSEKTLKEIDTRNLWVKTEFLNREAPDIERLGKIASKLNVDAILILRSYFVGVLYVTTDIFLADLKYKAIYADTIENRYAESFNAQDLTKVTQRLLIRMKES